MDIKEVGHTIQIAGVIYNSDKNQKTYLIMLPDEDLYLGKASIEKLTLKQWKDFFWQTDVLETELNDEAKTIVRKTQRQIAGNISWNVYHRDNYSCRYCGRTGLPLTVDHVILWEDGGPSIEENLVTSCKRCNRVRGNTPYEEWINSDAYKKVSPLLVSWQHELNHQIIDTLPKIPISFTKMRGKKR